MAPMSACVSSFDQVKLWKASFLVKEAQRNKDDAINYQRENSVNCFLGSKKSVNLGMEKSKWNESVIVISVWYLYVL